MLPTSTKIYLDVDGTLIHEELERYNQPAAHLKEFLEHLEPYPVYWLTTHCMDGDPNHVRRHLSKLLPHDIFQYVLRYEPTSWTENKTEAIDFTSDFVWFDNDVMSEEREELARHGAENNLVEVNLVDNPEYLGKIIERMF